MSIITSHVTPHERERGFTLIELLVVVIVIGVLAAVAIPVFLNQRKKADRASVDVDVKALGNAINLARLDGETLPIGTTPSVYAGSVYTPGFGQAWLDAHGVKLSPGNYFAGFVSPPTVDLSSPNFAVCVEHREGSRVTAWALWQSTYSGIRVHGDDPNKPQWVLGYATGGLGGNDAGPYNSHCANVNSTTYP